MTNEEVRATLNELAGLLVPVAGTLMSVACREGKLKHLYGCGCEVCRAFIAVHECQARLEVLALTLAPAAISPTTSPPGYDCLVSD